MARGGIVDDRALIKALRSGDIYSAALDVFEHEPNYYPDFLDLDNVVLSPHLGSSTVKTRRAMAMRAATNLVTGLKGDFPPDLINLEVKSSN